MARTADRYLKVKENIIKTGYRVADYIRLSVDSDYTGSDSIDNQRRLGQEYISKFDDMTLYAEYVDDGRTGTNFNRPSFEKMMLDVKRGLVNCIIVKDLSRFGREYLEAGNYIEKIFPFLEVRFISIVDGYDSNDSFCDKELLKITLKNLMHEMYAKDISKKVGSTYQMKQRKGIFYRSSNIPYGYKMNNENDNYIKDEMTAPIVIQIFSLYESGISKYAICNMMKEQGILTPFQYRKLGHVKKEQEDKFKGWHLSTVDRILSNEVYLGIVIRHKSENCLSENIRESKLPESEWVRIENNHEPIIYYEQFQRVKEMLLQQKDTYVKYRENSNAVNSEDNFKYNVYAGKLFCGDCKASMVRVGAYQMIKGVANRYKIFKCKSHRNMADMCDAKCIEEKVLCEILFTAIRQQLVLLNKLNKIVELNSKYAFDIRLSSISQEQMRINNANFMLKQKYMKAYDSYCDGILSAAGFADFRKQYLKKEAFFSAELEQLCRKEAGVKAAQKSYKRLITEWLEHGKSKLLTESMIEAFIEYIEVYKDKKIAITFRYQDCFLEVKKYLGEEM